MRRLMFALVVFTLPSGVNAQNPSPSPEEQYASLIKERGDSLKQATEGLQAAKTDEERKKVLASYPTVDRFGPRFLALAKKYPHTSAACDALVWIVGQSRVGFDTFPPSRIELTSEAMDQLARDHVDDKRVGQLCLSVYQYASPLRDKFLRTVYEKATNRDVRGRACLSLAEYLVRKADLVEQAKAIKPADRKPSFDLARDAYVQQQLATDPTLFTREAEQLFLKVIDEFGEFTARRGTTTFAQLAEGSLKALRQLRVGNAAPEIEGADVDGKRFKLSDFRGKIVAIVFTGDWCGPCRAEYPHERQLVTRLRDKPFALLGVNTDADKETLRTLISSGKVTWKCWWDSAMDGPICKAWNVQGFPSAVVLDANGVIRHSAVGLRGESLDKAVDGLLKELETSAPR
jgi:peroxiredoxin